MSQERKQIARWKEVHKRKSNETARDYELRLEEEEAEEKMVSQGMGQKSALLKALEELLAESSSFSSITTSSSKEELASLEKDFLSYNRSTYCALPIALTKRIIYYPQLHQTKSMLDNAALMDLVAFDQYRLLTFIRDNPDLVVFRESLCEEFNPDSGTEQTLRTVANEQFKHVPSSFNNTYQVQRNLLYEKGGVFIALYLGLITAVQPTTTTAFCTKWDAKIMGPLGWSHMPVIFQEREKDAVVRINKYLEMHPSKRVLLVFGAAHDFSSYFPAAEYCEVNPNQLASYPGFRPVQAPKTGDQDWGEIAREMLWRRRDLMSDAKMNKKR